MLTIANPIYDSVFKHLMEHQVVARGIISNLMGVEVVELVPQEARERELLDYTASTTRVLSLAFSARLRLADGSEHAVALQVQKARRAVDFAVEQLRQQLGCHYSRANGAAAGPAIPVIPVYFLGFPLGEPGDFPMVLKVRRQYLDGLSGKVLVGGRRHPLIEKLTHDAVVVQIPAIPQDLGARPLETPVEMALALFNQAHRTSDHHFLEFPDHFGFGEADTDAAGNYRHPQPPWLVEMIDLLTQAAWDEGQQRAMEVEDDLLNVVDGLEKLEQSKHRLEAERRQNELLLRQQEEARRAHTAQLLAQEAASQEREQAFLREIDELKRLLQAQGEA